MNLSGPRVHVLIVNYRTPGLAVDCLRSLAPEVAGRPGTRVLVGDAESGDGSVEHIAGAIERERWGGWATVEALGRNGGFAWGNNQLIARSRSLPAPADLLWLLNPDTIVRCGALAALADFFENRPYVGIAGSRLEDPDGTPQVAAFRFPSLASELEGSVNVGFLSRLLATRRVSRAIPDQSTRCDWVSGASLMARREVFDRVGLLDDRYFMYFEELDLCRRAAAAGYETWTIPASRVVHLVGQASGLTTGPTREKRRPAYWFSSRRWFWVKNHGPLVAAAADGARILGSIACRMAIVARRQPNWMPPCYLRDLIRHSVFVRGFRA